MQFLVTVDRNSPIYLARQVAVRCRNAGPVTLSVNGKRIGELAPDDRMTVIWDGVPLQPGKNDLALSSGSLKASATVESIFSR